MPRRASSLSLAAVVAVGLAAGLGFGLAAVLAAGAPAAGADWTVTPADTVPLSARDPALDGVLEEAARRQRSGDGWAAAWNAARVLAAVRDSAAHDGGARKRAERASGVLDKVGRDLSPGQLACLVAWWGPGPELSWAYSASLDSRGRRDEAATEALAFLQHYPHHKRAKDAAEVVRRGHPEGAPGLHQSVFRVAAVLPLSGAYRDYGRSLAAGLAAALEEEGGRMGLPILLDLHDSRGEAWTASRAARAALERGAGTLVGEVLSVPTLVVAAIGSGRGIPVFSPAASEERVAEAGEFVFQTGLSELEQGRGLARYAIEDLKLTRFAVAAGAKDTLGNLAAGFAQQAEASGATLVRAQSPGGARDFRAAADQLRRDKVEALLLPDHPAQAELWAAAVRSEGYGAVLLGSEALDPQALHPDARKDFEGTALVGLEYALPDSVFAALESLVQERYGFPADAFVRRGYLTGRILGMALRAGIASPRMMGESVSQRLVEPAPEHPSYRFVRWGGHEAVVPIYVVRRGELARVK